MSEINQIFDLLDKWKQFPAYQLERRADIFFAIYLEQILQEHLGIKSAMTIIPEFPVKKSIVDPKEQKNLSFKIDYLVSVGEKVFLVELKTDNSSRRTKQDEYLRGAQEANLPELIDGLIQIFQASKSKAKYTNLLTELQNLHWTLFDNSQWKNTSSNKEVSIIYIQPNKIEGQKGANTISFTDVIKVISKNNTELAQRFAASLGKWQEKSK